MIEKLTFEDGDVYEGETLNGVPNGKGKRTWKNGTDVYEGDFVNGKMTGKGKRAYLNGDVYEGEFVNAVPHGKGKESNRNGTIVYEGDWVDGKKHGKGTYTSESCTFEGEFVNGLQSKGKCTYKDGRVEEGNWKGYTFYGEKTPPEDEPYKPTWEDELMRLRYEICP